MSWNVFNGNNKKPYIFQCNDKRLKFLLRILLIVSLSLEVMVKYELFEVLEKWLERDLCLPIVLESDYLNEVFSATCTVAVLGNAILSLLFGVYDKKTLGVPFQDVLNYSMVGNEQKFTIEVLTASIIGAFLCYIFKCYNLLFALLIQDVFLLLFSCEDLWRFLSDKDMQRNTISEIIHAVDCSRYAIYVDSWFKALKDALAPNNHDEAKEYFELIELVITSEPNSDRQIRACVKRHLQSYFNTACDMIGFVEAFSLLKEVIKYAPEEDELDSRIALKYFNHLKTKDQLNTVDVEVVELIREICQDKSFCVEDKISYVFLYFCSIYDNNQIDPSVKNQQLERIMLYLCDMHESDHGEIKAKVLMNIVKHRILENDDLKKRKNLFCILTESLQKRRYLCDDKYYLATISEIYRAFFFVTTLEYGSLTDDYRNELLTLFHAKTDEKEMVPLSFMTLIRDRTKSVADWLAMDAISYIKRPKLFWDYRSIAMNWKKIVWNPEEVITFAFCVYHLFGEVYDEPPYKAILESDEFDDEEKIFVCKTLLERYGENCFGEIISQRINDIASFSRISYADSFWKPDHDYYQDKLIALDHKYKQSLYSGKTRNNAEIWEQINKLFDDKRLFVYDPSFSFFPGTRYTFDPEYVFLAKNYWTYLPNNLSEKLSDYLHMHMLDTLPSIMVENKMDDVKLLIEKLMDEPLVFRSSRFLTVFTIGPMIRRTQEYKTLLEILETIPYDPRNSFGENIFLKKEHVPFNYQMQYELIEPSEDECVTYVQSREKDGIYSVNGYLFDYHHALEYARMNMLRENFTIFIHVGIDTDDGFQVTAQR